MGEVRAGDQRAVVERLAWQLRDSDELARREALIALVPLASDGSGVALGALLGFLFTFALKELERWIIPWKADH